MAAGSSRPARVGIAVAGAAVCVSQRGGDTSADSCGHWRREGIAHLPVGRSLAPSDDPVRGKIWKKGAS